MQCQVLAMMLLVSCAQEKPFQVPENKLQRRDFLLRLAIATERRRITLEAPMHLPVALDDPARVALEMNVLERENFDRWLFPDDLSQEDRRQHLEDALDARVQLAVLNYKLSFPQKMKLRLAGKGDIKRFFDQVEDRRNAFETERKDIKVGVAALHRLSDLSRLYREGPFDDDSLFAKTLHRIEEEEKKGSR
jgi:hypothetical protein